VDFITLTHWPTFNVADSCVTIGAILLIVRSLRRAHPAERS
jgi:lipoprotein signal peptidase